MKKTWEEVERTKSLKSVIIVSTSDHRLLSLSTIVDIYYKSNHCCIAVVTLFLNSHCLDISNIIWWSCYPENWNFYNSKHIQWNILIGLAPHFFSFFFLGIFQVRFIIFIFLISTSLSLLGFYAKLMSKYLFYCYEFSSIQ